MSVARANALCDPPSVFWRRSLAAACALPSGGGRRHKQARSQIAAFVVNQVVDKAAEATHSAHVLARSHLDLRRSDTVHSWLYLHWLPVTLSQLGFGHSNFSLEFMECYSILAKRFSGTRARACCRLAAFICTGSQGGKSFFCDTEQSC